MSGSLDRLSRPDRLSEEVRGKDIIDESHHSATRGPAVARRGEIRGGDRRPAVMDHKNLAAVPGSRGAAR